MDGLDTLSIIVGTGLHSSETDARSKGSLFKESKKVSQSTKLNEKS